MCSVQHCAASESVGRSNLFRNSVSLAAINEGMSSVPKLQMPRWMWPRHLERDQRYLGSAQRENLEYKWLLHKSSSLEMLQEHFFPGAHVVSVNEVAR